MKRTEYIWLENKSNLRIYASAGIGENNGGMKIHPDTTMPNNEPFKREIEVQNKEILVSSPSIASLFKQTLSNKYLSVYIFNADSLDELGWEGIRDKNMVLKRYDLSLDDLKRSDFTITYP
ncbi:MAG TPA: hypothetical protein VFV37_06545 [Luteibaculaceae bacterium]|nr:hypothetical protein [Luteibaculaceae bacterium]